MSDRNDVERHAWNLEQASWRKERLLHYEGLFTVGSGLLQLRGSFDEQLPGEEQELEYLRRPANVTSEEHRVSISHRGTYLPPVRDDHPLLNSVVVNLPSPLGIELDVAGERMHALSRRVRRQVRRLDMRVALLERDVEWALPGGGALRATYERFVSRRRPNLVCQSVRLEAVEVPLVVTVTAGVDARVRTNGFDHYAYVRESSDGEGARVEIGTRSGSSAWVGSRIISDGGEAVESAVDRRRARQRLRLELQPGTARTLVKLSAVTGSAAIGRGAGSSQAPPADLAREGTSILDAACEAGWDTLKQEHAADWESLWREADIRLRGDDVLDRRLRFSVFSMLRAHRVGITSYSICPKGHAGEAYFGRYFWDTEIYLLPFFIHAHPEHARDLLRFRVQSLSGARRNAKRYGYAGARLAWEADGGGDEHCPNWQYADHEIHVTADFAFALAHYVHATGDDAFLFEEAMESLVETARYWIDRIDVGPRGEAELLGVMGPDEYKPFSRNNSFTNHLVAFHLRYAAHALVRCRSERPGRWERLVRAIGVSADEASSFERTAAAIPVRVSDDGVILQSDDFSRYVDVDVRRLRRDAGGKLGVGGVASVVGQERLYRIKALKQADVVALLALFPDDFSADVKRRSYEFYEPITTHDSSLSASAHATVAAQLGKADEALDFLRQSSAVDADDEAGDASHGIHIANCGGNWQTIVYGFAGVRPAYAGEELVVQPRLPDGIDSIALPLFWRGSRLQLTVSRERVSVARTDGPPLEVRIGTDRRLVQESEEWTYE